MEAGLWRLANRAGCAGKGREAMVAGRAFKHPLLQPPPPPPPPCLASMASPSSSSFPFRSFCASPPPLLRARDDVERSSAGMARPPPLPPPPCPFAREGQWQGIPEFISLPRASLETALAPKKAPFPSPLRHPPSFSSSQQRFAAATLVGRTRWWGGIGEEGALTSS